MLFCCLAFTLFIGLSSAASEGDTWHYPEDDFWTYISGGVCNGTRQSPINITTSDAESPYAPGSYPLLYSPEYFSTLSGVLKNTGHGIQFNPAADGPVPTVFVNGTEYAFAQLHWHWGSNGMPGSEHWIDEYYYPMEVHLVHYKASFDSIGSAVASEEGDALAVFGFFFHPDGGKTDWLIKRVGSKLCQYLTQSGAEVEFELSLAEILMGSYGVRDFYEYMGSLTTPTCNEIVHWFVHPNPIPITEEQLKPFRKLWKLTNNARLPQPLNNRPIYAFPGMMSE